MHTAPVRDLQARFVSYMKRSSAWMDDLRTGNRPHLGALHLKAKGSPEWYTRMCKLYDLADSLKFAENSKILPLFPYPSASKAPSGADSAASFVEGRVGESVCDRFKETLKGFDSHTRKAGFRV